MRGVFAHPVSGREAAKQLLNLRHGNLSVVDYTIKFRTLAAESQWNPEALISTFQNSFLDAI